MARPKSDDKRSALVEAAIRVILVHGLGAPTATIAHEAGVASGSLFTYFETKAALFNELYRELKAEMAAAALEEFPGGAEFRKQLFHVWRNWVHWAVSNPSKRRVLALLSVSDDITAASKAAGHKSMAGIAELLKSIHASGSMRQAPMAFLAAIMNSLAETTMDFMVQDSKSADKHCKQGFEALWRVIE